MKCSGCGAENREGRRFCSKCGAALSLACPSCGFANEAGDRFCGGCGAMLEAAGEVAPGRPAAAPPAPPSGERRQVTIVFADLTGYTELSRTLDAEELHALINRFFDAIDGVVEDYGGTVDKHIGDAVMALFGAPVAHGDDPERAVRAAFEMHRATAALGEELGRPLRVHVGIASGEVVAAGLGRDDHREYTVIGESVNLAARLDELAEPGETLISDAVRRAVDHRVECEALDEVAVKGIDKPVAVWRVRALRSEAVDAARGHFVGRDAELRQFSGIAESCRETGNGQAVFVRGEVGIGKSRLVEEFAAIAKRLDFARHRALVLDFGVGRGQDAVRTLVRSLLDIAPGGGEPARQAAAERSIAEGLLDAGQRPFLNDLLDLPQPVEMRAMYDAMDNDTRNRGKREVVARLIKELSLRAPILVTIEDVHWADPATLAHLAAVTTTVRDCRAVLLMTSRIDGDPLDQAWRGATRGSPLITIDLGPLRRDEAVELAGEFIDATNRWALTCIDRAEGNPLFLEQLLRGAEESADEDVPATVQSLVLARMDRLPGGDKRALQAASVLGQRFALETLRHLLGEDDYGCDGLVGHTLVRPEGDEFLIAHSLIQECVYASLLKTRKRELHLRAADWFAGREAVLHAQHLDRAEDPAAPRAYLGAAEGLALEYRFGRALELVGRGLELASGEADEYALTCFRGELLRDLGSVPESIEAFRRALDIAADDTMRCQAWIGLAAGMRVSDSYDQALEALERAEAAARAQSLDHELSQVHYYRGNIYFPLGNIEGCLEQHRLALDTARRAGSPECEARALSGLGDAYYASGRMITSLDNFRRCIELCRAHGFGRIEVANQYMVAWTRTYLNEMAGALDDALAANDAAARVGHRRAEMVARLTAGRVLCEMADFEAAEPHIERGLELAESLGASRFKPFLMIFLARIRFARSGHRRETVTLMEEAVETSRKTGFGFLGPWVLSTLALISDDASASAAALREGESVLRNGCVGHNYPAFHRDAMDVALRGGDWDEAERHADALEAYTRPEPLPLADYFIARGRALAAHGRDPGDAETMAALRRLRDEAGRDGLRLALPALDRALAG